MKQFATAATLVIGLSLAAGQAWALDTGDAQAGKAAFSQRGCMACHGAGGHSTNGQFPKLAGQYADYIVHALTQYKSGKRQNAIMNGQAANLSTQDMENIASYLANQEKTTLVTPKRW